MSSPSFVFRLSETGAKLNLRRGDITAFSGDAIVNAANERMLGGGGVDGAIHRAGGQTLLQACLQVPEVTPNCRCPTGEARLTSGAFGSLQVNHVIHTVGPRFQASNEQESAQLLAQAYSSVLCLCNEVAIKSIAFPAISCGVYGYPLHTASSIALAEILRGAQHLDDITFFLFGEREFDAWQSSASQLLFTPLHQKGS